MSDKSDDLSRDMDQLAVLRDHNRSHQYPNLKYTPDSADDLFAPDWVREILYRYRIVRTASYDGKHDTINLKLGHFLAAVDEAYRAGYSDRMEEEAL
jgi:hypothetical protein